jgi:translation elongation factor EF-4
MSKELKVVQVAFSPRDLTRKYSYFIDDNEHCIEGAPAVVYAGSEYKVVTLVKVDHLTKEEKRRATAWIVHVIDVEAHRARVQERLKEIHAPEIKESL